MGQSFPCHRVRYTDLEPALPVKDTIPNGGARYYGFYISKSMKESGLDLVIKLQVLKGFFAGLYVAPDERFPSSRRKVWSQERYCLCESPDCDYCWPDCLNPKGGICSSCRLHDQNWTRTSHDLKLGQLAKNTEFTQFQLNSAGVLKPKATGSKSKQFDQTNGKFGIRIDLSSPEVKAGHYFLTVEALKIPEIEDEKGFRKEVGIVKVKGKDAAPDPQVDLKTIPNAPIEAQNKENGKEEKDRNTYVVWIEQRVKRGEPFLGNEGATEDTELDRAIDEKGNIEL